MAKDIKKAAGPKRKKEVSPKDSIVSVSSAKVAKQHKVVRFRNRPMLLVDKPYEHYVPLRKELFDLIGYPILGGVTRSRMNDVFAFLASSAVDMTDNDRYILFGSTDVVAGSPTNQPLDETLIWDSRNLEFDSVVDFDGVIWRSPYALPKTARQSVREFKKKRKPIKFVMDLAGGDEGLYDDIMQSIAPMIMERKPDGVVWWVGDGANGKSTLMDALYKIFPGQLSSITVSRLTDGRDTPSLNGTLANIVKESSEGRIDDTQIYKSIGTHEDFKVHKFHSQDDITIRGNLHHIFSGNSIPVFNDKGYSARRRTYIVPFNQRFASDPTFEDRIFTTELLQDLVVEMCVYANRIKAQGYRYKWSAETLSTKSDYDKEANNAEEYAKTIINDGVVAFESFNPVRIDYENWCADNGFVPLGVANMRRALQGAGFVRRTFRRTDRTTSKRYQLDSVDSDDITPVSNSRPGLYTLPGFMPPEVETKPSKPVGKQRSILGDDW